MDIDRLLKWDAVIESVDEAANNIFDYVTEWPEQPCAAVQA